MRNQSIPIVDLQLSLQKNSEHSSEIILQNEIKGTQVEHIAVTGTKELFDYTKQEFKTIFLFIKGNGYVKADKKIYSIVPETILLPNIVECVSIRAEENETLHFLKISSELTVQDQIDLKELPKENTQTVYYAKFTDCQSYTEAIKSPNTISRTILSNKYIPRIAMGTVYTKGPDKVDAHEHPMLEQLFLGLSNNHCTVYADNDQVEFIEYSILHIPLGSRHSVSVKEDHLMHYVWMDFFLDKKGEEWLKTHKAIED